MLREKRQLIEVLFMAADLFAVTVAWFAAYWLRFSTDIIPTDKGIPPFENYASMVLVILVIWAAVFRWMGLYRAMRGVRRIREIFSLVNANVLAVLVFIAVTYLFREKEDPFSRLVLVYFGSLATLFTVAQRMVLRTMLRELRRRGYNLRFMVIVGTGQVAEDIVRRVRSHRELGVQLVGAVADGSVVASSALGPGGLPILGAYGDLGSILDNYAIDHVTIALSLHELHKIPDVMTAIGDRLVDVRIVPDLYQFVSLGGQIEEFDGLPVLSLQTTPLDGIGLWLKRLFDVIVGSILVLLFAPVMIVLSILIKLTSRGPVLYRQQRVSYDGSEFWLLKFRSMVVDSEKTGPGWTTSNDDRVTPLGRVLRRWSLDELPQLLNVVRGDMSLVGPRPERPVYIEQFRQRIPRYMLRHKVPAGITGWAQVNGWRGDTSIDKRIECDLYYIENWSLWLDVKILFLTIFRGFRHSNAY